MENKNLRSSKKFSQRALSVYVGVCAILVLVILYSAFQRTDSGMLPGEIYLRSQPVPTLEK